MNATTNSVELKRTVELRCGFMDTRDAAWYIGMSEAYLRAARVTGDLEGQTPAPPYVKIGKKSVRYALTDLDKWIERQRRFKGGIAI